MTGKCINIQVLFSALITAAFAYGVWEARSYDFLARIFPFYVSLFLLIVAAVNLVMEIRASFGGTRTAGSGIGDLETRWEIPMTEVWKRLGFYVGIILVLYLAIGVGFIRLLDYGARFRWVMRLMLLLMTVTIFYLPLVLPLLLSGAEVSPGAIARSLVVMMLIPLLAGLGVRARFRAAAERARPVFARISNIALLVMTATLLILHGGSLIDLFGFGVLAIILLLLAAVALGWFLGGPGRGTRVVLSLGTGQRNISAGIIVASQNFPDPDVTLTLIAAAILGLVIMLPAAGKLSRGKT